MFVCVIVCGVCIDISAVLSISLEYVRKHSIQAIIIVIIIIVNSVIIEKQNSQISCAFAYETACNTIYSHVIVFMLWSVLLCTFVINDLHCLLTKCDIIRSECMIAFVRSMTSPCPT